MRFDAEGLEGEAERLFTLRKRYDNAWLGVHQIAYSRRHGLMPEGPLRSLAGQIIDRIWRPEGVMPNVCYLQFIDDGERVNPHRDPMTDLHFTTIAWFGDFEGGKFNTRIDRGGLPPLDVDIEARSGMVIRLPCTVNGKQGPLHWTDEVTKGRRWSLILNHSTKHR